MEKLGVITGNRPLPNQQSFDFDIFEKKSEDNYGSFSLGTIKSEKEVSKDVVDNLKDLAAIKFSKN